LVAQLVQKPPPESCRLFRKGAAGVGGKRLRFGDLLVQHLYSPRPDAGHWFFWPRVRPPQEGGLRQRNRRSLRSHPPRSGQPLQLLLPKSVLQRQREQDP